MKGSNDAWNMCIHQCIVSGWLFRAELVKGHNSGRYRIINLHLVFLLYVQRFQTVTIDGISTIKTKLIV